MYLRNLCILHKIDKKREKMEKFNATKYKNDFTKEKYDRLNIQVPKGQKAVIEEHWESN